MKFCIKCGKKIEADSAFCPFCGAKQPSPSVRLLSQVTSSVSKTGDGSHSRQSAQQTDASPVNQPISHPTTKTSHSSLSIIIGVIVLVIVAGLGKYGYNTYQRNHLSDQEIADMSRTVVSKHLGSNNEVYYSKSTNTIDVVPIYGSNFYEDVEEVIVYGEGTESLSNYLEELKKISEEMADQMPTKDHDVKVQLLNPENEDRHLYIIENGTITYDFSE
ncbi:zinc ribbon domain-containing protein [Companilactobacillus allii]|uniref:Zinc-ribbon domain-containing protein n=1 Tax=Companilactobacillus allii TaxID=1847728 RepID=A0A1P8Q5U8_9LACO|nr:zinc ribbon domain-containing protein [Companilactobacillus allii]APX73211.1 hypothetical protein BTM29_11915 [Companilactobacillus allii]USQ68020.1 zinc ribbon domain-containing protein [Companilactobacillus allii]